MFHFKDRNLVSFVRVFDWSSRYWLTSQTLNESQKLTTRSLGSENQHSNRPRKQFYYYIYDDIIRGFFINFFKL